MKYFLLLSLLFGAAAYAHTFADCSNHEDRQFDSEIPRHLSFNI